MAIKLQQLTRMSGDGREKTIFQSTYDGSGDSDCTNITLKEAKMLVQQCRAMLGTDIVEGDGVGVWSYTLYQHQSSVLCLQNGSWDEVGSFEPSWQVEFFPHDDATAVRMQSLFAQYLPAALRSSSSL